MHFMLVKLRGFAECLEERIFSDSDRKAKNQGPEDRKLKEAGS